MKTTLSEEQKELVRSVGALFARECPPSLVRQLQNSETLGKPSILWDHLTKFGAFGLTIPELYGGYGGTLFDLGLVYEQGGRVLCPTIVYSTLEFGLALARLAPNDARLPSVVAGSPVGAIAVADPNDGSNVSPSLTADWLGTKWSLWGQIDFVENADTCDFLLATARAREAVGGFHDMAVLVPRDALRATRRRTFARDSQSLVHFDGVELDPSNVITNVTADDLRWIANAVTALRCMDMVGGAQAVIEQTVAYLKERIQFGRPLASFQATQHHIANMHIAVEGARFAAYQAVSFVSSGKIAERETAIAKLKTNEAYKLVTLTAHQLHGGMGFVRDTDLHLWSERAKVMELRYGAWETQIRRLAAALRLDA